MDEPESWDKRGHLAPNSADSVLAWAVRGCLELLSMPSSK